MSKGRPHDAQIRRLDRREHILQRLQEPPVTGTLPLQRSLWDSHNVRRAAKCLQEHSIHTLDLSYGRWRREDDNETPLDESIRRLASPFRNAQTARSLQVLNLSYLSSGNDVAVNIMDNLVTSGSCGLSELYLRHTGLTRKGIQSLVALLEQAPLQVLDVAYNRHMGLDGMRELAQGVRTICKKESTGSRLRQLDVSGCLGDTDGADLIEAISHLPELHTLVWNKNCLGLASRAALTLFLEKCHSLRTLKFGHYGNLVESAQDSQRFAVSLAASQLKILDLSLYLAEPGSIRRLLTLLPSMRTLQELTIFARAMPLLAKVLPQFTSLHTLTVVRDEFEWTPAVQRAFYQNYSLHKRISISASNNENAQETLGMLVTRNRAFHSWQTASESERALLVALWPRILAKLSSSPSSLSPSCCLEVLRRGIVE